MRTVVTILFGLLLHSFAWSAGTEAAAEVPDSERHLTASDLFDMEFAVNPQVSPDGKRVIYVRQFADVTTDRRYSNLWIVNTDGSEHRPLTTGHHGDSSPSWSPDGTRIAFVSDRAGSAQIHMLWMDNGRVAKLTNMQRPPSNLAWSPDGTRLAFNAVVPAPGEPLAKMPAAPEGAEWAAPPQFIDRLVYRFNNRGYLPTAARPGASPRATFITMGRPSGPPTAAISLPMRTCARTGNSSPWTGRSGSSRWRTAPPGP
jgi:dipeptidyl aminopeptidase/acylaminoacyl peptidase